MQINMLWSLLPLFVVLYFWSCCWETGIQGSWKYYKAPSQLPYVVHHTTGWETLVYMTRGISPYELSSSLALYYGQSQLEVSTKKSHSNISIGLCFSPFLTSHKLIWNNYCSPCGVGLLTSSFCNLSHIYAVDKWCFCSFASVPYCCSLDILARRKQHKGVRFPCSFIWLY